MRTILYKLGAFHSPSYKLALIHKFPKPIAKLILDLVSKDNIIETLSLGELIQVIKKVILDLCTNTKAQK